MEDTPFYKSKINNKDKNEISDFLKVFDLKLIFTNSHGMAGLSEDIIFINRFSSLSEAWSTIFHELQHFICYRGGIFIKYHNMHILYKKKWYKKYLKRMGLKIEIYVDKKAEELMKIYLPDIPYTQSYRTQESKTWYNNWIEENF